jgi:hypothetical protein
VTGAGVGLGTGAGVGAVAVTAPGSTGGGGGRFGTDGSEEAGSAGRPTPITASVRAPTEAVSGAEEGDGAAGGGKALAVTDLVGAALGAVIGTFGRFG